MIGDTDTEAMRAAVALARNIERMCVTMPGTTAHIMFTALSMAQANVALKCAIAMPERTEEIGTLLVSHATVARNNLIAEVRRRTLIRTPADDARLQRAEEKRQRKLRQSTLIAGATP